MTLSGINARIEALVSPEAIGARLLTLMYRGAHGEAVARRRAILAEMHRAERHKWLFKCTEGEDPMILRAARRLSIQSLTETASDLRALCRALRPEVYGYRTSDFLPRRPSHWSSRRIGDYLERRGS